MTEIPHYKGESLRMLDSTTFWQILNNGCFIVFLNNMLSAFQKFLSLSYDSIRTTFVCTVSTSLSSLLLYLPVPRFIHRYCRGDISIGKIRVGRQNPPTIELKNDHVFRAIDFNRKHARRGMYEQYSTCKSLISLTA